MKNALLGAMAIAVLSSCTQAPAYAATACVDVAAAKAPIVARQGRWTELTPEQWQFLRGVYAINPTMPLPGLPYGDKAVLVTVPGNDAGLAWFIDGDRACTPMALPKALVEMVLAVGAGDLNHEGKGA